MDFFDRPVENGFDRMFDMDRDGDLDPLEQGMQLEFLEHDGSFDDDTDDFDDAMDEVDDALDSIGYTREDLEFMDENERAEVLEEAGLDPDDLE